MYKFLFHWIVLKSNRMYGKEYNVKLWFLRISNEFLLYTNQ